MTLKSIGTARGDEKEPLSLLIIFNQRPTDEEMRAVHDFLRRSPAACPFCKKPTYALPCTSCGEPDTSPNDF